MTERHTSSSSVPVRASGAQEMPEAPYCGEHQGVMVARDEMGREWYCSGCERAKSAAVRASGEPQKDRRVTEQDLQDILKACGHRGDSSSLEYLTRMGLRIELYPRELLEIIQTFLDAARTRALLKGTVEGWKARTVEKLASASPSDDGARQPQEQDGHIDWDEERFKRIGKAVREHQRVGQEASDVDFLYRKCSELAAELAAQPAAQGWTAQDGFTLDRIEQTLKTIRAITQDDAHWLIAQVTKLVKASSSVADNHQGEIARLTAAYVTPALNALYDKVMAGEPLTYFEIALWNNAAGPELQIAGKPNENAKAPARSIDG